MNLIDRAIVFATLAHEGQSRKGSDIPYITYPISVGMLLAQVGCSKMVIAAGLLHDTVEDTKVTIEDIEREFGQEVSRLVSAASEPDKSAEWEERKEHTLEFLKTAPLDVKYVVCADKHANARSMVDDLSTIGPSFWDRFNRGRKQQLWYYSAICNSLMNGIEPSDIPDLFYKYRDTVEELRQAGQ